MVQLSLITPPAPPTLPAGIDLRCCDTAEMLVSLTERADLVIADPPWLYSQAHGASVAEDHFACLSAAQIAEYINAAAQVGSRLAPVVGYLLRSTFLGAAERLEWWQRRPPSDVIVVLPRPAWEGPGKRATTDRVDSLFIVWRGAVAGSTRLHWLDAKEGA